MKKVENLDDVVVLMVVLFQKSVVIHPSPPMCVCVCVCVCAVTHNDNDNNPSIHPSIIMQCMHACIQGESNQDVFRIIHLPGFRILSNACGVWCVCVYDVCLLAVRVVSVHSCVRTRVIFSL